jgi:four helix bundle protein
MKEYSFEKLEVWQLAKKFVIRIYKASNKFPDSEKYCIVNQLRRAAISIPNNIAEGSGRVSGKDKANYTQIAFGSLMECLNLIIISHELNFIDDKKTQILRNDIEILSRKLSNLRRAQLSCTPKPLNP